MGYAMADWTDLFDARLAMTPPVADEQLADIPAKRGVLLLTGPDDAPVVMVTAADMRSRARSRLASPAEEQASPAAKTRITKTPDLRQITQAILYKRCESFFETELQFLEIARQIWPGRYEKLLAWKQPWFVYIDLDEPYPHLAKKPHRFFCENLSAQACSRRWAIGPFAGGRDADKFIEALQDTFDLCRSVKCLRNAPNGPRCAYAEINRCLSPADGTISMDDYRQVLAWACKFAAGQREGLARKLRSEMSQASEELQFERASACKTRLDRLAFFEGERFRQVGLADFWPRPEACEKDEQYKKFRKILIQPGAGKAERRVFLATLSEIIYAGPVHYPAKAEQLEVVLKAMTSLGARIETPSQASGLGLGLILRTLRASPARRGLVVDWQENLNADKLAEMMNREIGK